MSMCGVRRDTRAAQRRLDYMPQKPLMPERARPLLEQFVRERGGRPESDAYLRFMVEELKPFVDAAYRTRPDRAHTVVMGSCLGGLISLYALTEYPAVFGGAGCVSTHWPSGGSLLVDYFAPAITGSTLTTERKLRMPPTSRINCAWMPCCRRPAISAA
jgi:predicted alpha/beta superfamily hydrolase